MKWPELLSKIAAEAVFSPSLLLAGEISVPDLQRQLSRWVQAGKLLQIRRSLYALAKPYRKVAPNPFLVANRLRSPSYVSMQSALAYYSMIPEYVPVVTSVTTGRPGNFSTPLGSFVFRHIKPALFHRFVRVEIEADQWAFIATPEKSLLDLIYLNPGADRRAYLAELRLGNLSSLNSAALLEAARDSGSPKLRRAAEHIAELMKAEGYENL